MTEVSQGEANQFCSSSMVLVASQKFSDEIDELRLGALGVWGNRDYGLTQEPLVCVAKGGCVLLL